jgi:hypothetical protein
VVFAIQKLQGVIDIVEEVLLREVEGSMVGLHIWVEGDTEN